MVSIVAFQAVDPGSTPGQRISHFFLPHCGTFYSPCAVQSLSMYFSTVQSCYLCVLSYSIPMF